MFSALNRQAIRVKVLQVWLHNCREKRCVLLWGAAWFGARPHCLNPGSELCSMSPYPEWLDGGLLSHMGWSVLETWPLITAVTQRRTPARSGIRYFIAIPSLTLWLLNSARFKIRQENLTLLTLHVSSVRCFPEPVTWAKLKPALCGMSTIEIYTLWHEHKQNLLSIARAQSKSTLFGTSTIKTNSLWHKHNTN
jgi:hypothetical protein